jgi:hypothetical protein
VPTNLQKGGGLYLDNSNNDKDGMDRAREGDTAVSQARGISISESRERERSRTSFFPVGATSDEEKEAIERAKERAKEETETKERTSFFPKSPEKGANSQKSSVHGLSIVIY